MKVLTLTKTTKTKMFISCILTCFILTACDDSEEKPQKVITPPLVTVQTETNSNDAEVNIDELDDLLNEISVETGQPLNEIETVEEPQEQVQVTDNKPIVEWDTNILAVSLSKGLATGFNYQLLNNKQWKQGEKDCFGKINDDFVVNELDKIVKVQLSQDEFQQATQFYHSSASKQLEQWRDSHLNEVITNNNISINNMNIAEEDLSLITDFMGSSANIKINQLLQSPQIEQLVKEKISPQLLACGMADNYQ